MATRLRFQRDLCSSWAIRALPCSKRHSRFSPHLSVFVLETSDQGQGRLRVANRSKRLDDLEVGERISSLVVLGFHQGGNSLRVSDVSEGIGRLKLHTMV